MEKIRLGKIINAVGLKGELKIFPYTDYKEKFEEIDYVIIEDTPFSIDNVRYVKNMAILKLKGIENRDKAELKKEKELFILRKDMPPLPEGSFYVKDLIGLKAVGADGELIGSVCDVIINSAQDIYMIDPGNGGKAFPVPAVEEFVKRIDLDSNVMVLELIEGLKEL